MKTSAFFLVLTLSAIFFCVSATSAQTVDVTITGLRTDKGGILMGIFKDNESFKDDKPLKRTKFSKSTINSGTIKVSMQLSLGVYAISLLDDENGNAKMDYNMLHMPKEGFGFSNYYLKGLTKPHFDEFKFEVKPNGATAVVKMKYM